MQSHNSCAQATRRGGSPNTFVHPASTRRAGLARIKKGGNKARADSRATTCAQESGAPGSQPLPGLNGRNQSAGRQRLASVVPTPAKVGSNAGTRPLRACSVDATDTHRPAAMAACLRERGGPSGSEGRTTHHSFSGSYSKNKKEQESASEESAGTSRMERREVIVTVCLLVLAAADTTRSVTVPSVTEVCGDPRIAHSHVAVSTDAPSGCRPGPRSWGVTFC